MNMNDFLIYDLKVAVLIIVFYMFYRLLLAKETFHRVNRVVLLLTAMASFVLPLCVITFHKTMLVEALPSVEIGDIETAAMPDAPSASPPVAMALPILYITGVMAVLGHTMASILKVGLLIHRSEKHPQPDGTILCVTGRADVAPFSWMRYIVMNRRDGSFVATKEPSLQDAANSPMNGDTYASGTPGTCSSWICSPPSSGLTLRCGCCVRTCAPSTSMRPTVRYSLKGLTRVNINIC